MSSITAKNLQCPECCELNKEMMMLNCRDKHEICLECALKIFGEMGENNKTKESHFCPLSGCYYLVTAYAKSGSELSCIQSIETLLERLARDSARELAFKEMKKNNEEFYLNQKSDSEIWRRPDGSMFPNPLLGAFFH